MMLRKNHILGTLVMLWTTAATAALGGSVYVKQVSPFPTVIGQDSVGMPYLGGFNDPKPSLLDIDHDGLIDLIIGQPDGRLLYLRNVGTVTVPRWQMSSTPLRGIDIGTWHRFADIDGDGDPDLFCDSRVGTVSFYRNESTSGGLSFVLADTAFAGFNTGLNNTPDFADLDHDGDLDFFFGDPNGTLSFYENIGDMSNPSFAPMVPFYDSILAFPGGGNSAPNGLLSPQHGFSAIRFVDIDGDNDLDLFWGDLFNPNMYAFFNLGNMFTSDLTFISEDFLPAATAGFNHPAFADLDGDGDLDMVVGAANGADRDNLLFYRNDGSRSAPSFTTLSENYIETIDFGSFSFPAAGDIDGDHDFDILVGTGSGRIIMMRNVGTALAPVFNIDTTGSFAAITAGLNTAPCLIDWDSDGDLDLLVGNRSGQIEYWRNDGDSADFSPVLVTTQLGGIKVDQLAVPAAADLNDDGLPDLLVGEWDFNSRANVRLYANVGAPDQPSLQLRATGILPAGSFREFTLPSVMDWDGDGRADLVVGSRHIGVTWYRNTSPVGAYPDSSHLLPQPDTLPGWSEGTHLAWTTADIDTDGDLDLFIGEADGGINFYRRLGSCCQGKRGNV
ncbi:MAG: VCBS repeat-containing protein, partial [Candidatus Zixiibacteriota bacterium]